MRKFERILSKISRVTTFQIRKTITDTYIMSRPSGNVANMTAHKVTPCPSTSVIGLRSPPSIFNPQETYILFSYFNLEFLTNWNHNCKIIWKISSLQLNKKYNKLCGASLWLNLRSKSSWSNLWVTEGVDIITNGKKDNRIRFSLTPCGSLSVCSTVSAPEWSSRWLKASEEKRQ